MLLSDTECWVEIELAFESSQFHLKDLGFFAELERIGFSKQSFLRDFLKTFDDEKLFLSRVIGVFLLKR